MNETNNDLSYVRQILNNAEQQHGYPAIYLLWGCLILIGYMVAEWALPWTGYYWLIAAPVGMLLSARIGYQQHRMRGQITRGDNKYMPHFAVTVVLIFVAIYTDEFSAILLLISLSYGLAGVHLDRLMLWIGVLTLVCFFAIEYGWLRSNLVLGVVLSSGFFLAAWRSAADNAAARGNDA